MKEIRKRLRSKAVWIAVLSQVLLILIICKPEVTDQVKIISTAILEILTSFGILNNPTDSENF